MGLFSFHLLQLAMQGFLLAISEFPEKLSLTECIATPDSTELCVDQSQSARVLAECNVHGHVLGET